MFILNTTYTVEPSCLQQWIQWIREEFFVVAVDSKLMHEPKLYKVMVAEEQGPTYSVQLKAESLSDLREWLNGEAKVMGEAHSKIFGQKALGFSTVLKEV